jgi:hypothetical protein
MVYANFKGNQIEAHALVAALSHNCDCKFGVFGMRLTTCPPHRALLEDAPWLDRMLFERWLMHRENPDAAQRQITGS